jgi:hypothetical protein
MRNGAALFLVGNNGMTTCRQQPQRLAAKNTFRGIEKPALAFHGA